MFYSIITDVAFSFDKDNAQMLSLLTSGQLSCSAAWAVDEEGSALVPPSQIPSTMKWAFNQPSNQSPASIFLTAPVGGWTPLLLLEWQGCLTWTSCLNGLLTLAWIPMTLPMLISGSTWRCFPSLKVDFAFFILILRWQPIMGGDSVMSSPHLPVHFHLEQMQEEFNFALDDDMDKSRRFRMLQLRQQEVPEFKNKIVPAMEKELPEDIFMVATLFVCSFIQFCSIQFRNMRRRSVMLRSWSQWMKLNLIVLLLQNSCKG